MEKGLQNCFVEGGSVTGIFWVAYEIVCRVCGIFWGRDTVLKVVGERGVKM